MLEKWCYPNNSAKNPYVAVAHRRDATLVCISYILFTLATGTLSFNAVCAEGWSMGVLPSPTHSILALFFSVVGVGIFFRVKRVRIWRIQDLITAEMRSSDENKELAYKWNLLDWSEPATHLRFNARRMRENASFALTTILIVAVIALGFYSLADRLVISPNTESERMTTFAARIGVGVILIFTTQVLANIYRYSVRMSAFYESRAIMLMIHRKDPKLASMSELVASFAGDKVEFGNMPRSPVELAKAVFERSRTTAETTTHSGTGGHAAETQTR